jgi:hypothetical protein
MPTKHPATQPQRVAPAPQPPARISPRHLPAMHHVAADLDDTYPVRIVNPAELGPCEDCRDHDLDELGSIATVIAYDPSEVCWREDFCALHLRGAVRHHGKAGRHVVVEVPVETRQWFVRDDRETYYGLDDAHGIGVSRTHLGGWVVWDVLDGVTRSAPLAVFPADHGDPAARLDAECWAQDHAARLAAEAYEAASAVTVALPVVQDVTAEAAA